MGDASRPKVVVATDLGAKADEAIALGFAWAAECRGTLDIVHVVEESADATPLSAARALRARVTALIGGDADFSVSIDQGEPAAAIVARATSIGAHLVVVGASAAPRRRLVPRGVIDRVLTTAPCPVLVARRAYPSGRVLVATDFTDPALPAVAAAARAALRRGARLTALHAIDDGLLATAEPGGASFSWSSSSRDEFALVERRLARSLARFGTVGAAVAAEGPPATAILTAARTLCAELVVVGNHGRRGLRRLFHRNVASTVARLSSSPVLVVPLRDAARRGASVIRQ